MSNLMAHAEQELKWAGYSPECEDPMDQAIYKHTMMIVQHFSLCGHSGGSAPIHLDMIEKLLRFEPLGPITDNPDEWQHVGEDGFDGPTWQNRRDGRMFSHDGGRTYYSVDELRRGWKRKLFGRIGKKYRALPWEVKL
jgi:hypothetical protein